MWVSEVEGRGKPQVKPWQQRIWWCNHLWRMPVILVLCWLLGWLVFFEIWMSASVWSFPVQTRGENPSMQSCTLLEVVSFLGNFSYGAEWREESSILLRSQSGLGLTGVQALWWLSILSRINDEGMTKIELEVREQSLTVILHVCSLMIVSPARVVEGLHALRR